MRRYIDMTGANESLKAEFYSLADETEQARAQLAAERDANAKTVRRITLGAAIVPFLTGLVGWWRGRKSTPQMVVKSARPTEKRPS